MPAEPTTRRRPGHTPPPARIDGRVLANASDTGAGAVISVEGLEADASSVRFVRALRRMPGMSHDELSSEPAAGSHS